ncbi:MAG: A/G-specific adenine glycosylase [Rhodothermales bacterium]
MHSQLKISPARYGMLTDRILAWYAANKRPMPWRDQPNAYRVWISEIMLQQTQVATVIPYFKRFVDRFPDIASLAEAEQDDVLKLWEGLGYYSRARNLHKAAKLVIDSHDGQIPGSFCELCKLPGLGDYTAAAIASIVYGEAIPAVDGNVLRVVARWRGLPDDIGKTSTRDSIRAWLTPFTSPAPADFNQAMMELGALVCRPRQPRCLACPLQSECVALATGRIDELPVKARRKPVPTRTRLAAVIRDDDRILLRQRSDNEMLGGLWGLPMAENPEELGCEVRKELAMVKHTYSHFHLHLTAWSCELRNPLPDTTWVPLSTLDSLAFDKATLKLLAKIS